MKTIRISILCASALLLAACSKNTQPEAGSEFINFAISSPELELSANTKSVITEDNLSSMTVKAYGTMGGTEITNLSPATLNYNSTTKIWKPGTSVAWTDGKAYVFRAYATTPASGDANITIKSSDALSFSAQQPVSYNASAMQDILISKSVTISSDASYSHPTIALSLDHILPAVSVYVTRAANMKEVRVTALTLAGFFYKVNLQYDSYSKDWIRENLGTRDASYSIPAGSYNVGTESSNTDAKFWFITVPQGLSTETTLEVTYEVNESMDSTPSWRSYTQIFDLGNQGLSNLDCGYRTTFHLTIDTGIHIKGAIVPWNAVDFIEGTVLPPIDYD